MESETRKTPAAAEGKGVITLRIPSVLSNTPPTTHINTGDALGRHLVISRLHASETSVVYTGHDTELDRTVAIKVLPPTHEPAAGGRTEVPSPTGRGWPEGPGEGETRRSLQQSREARELLRQQAKTLARINSPHVVTLYEMLDLPVGSALVMEHLVGQTLAQKLYNQVRLTLQEAGTVFAQALTGLERIHRQGIVHGDLKPDNIFITTDHAVKLLDFRLARCLDKACPATGPAIGNLLYAAPEQLTGKPADFRSDLYTLGLGLYEAVTGSLPFETGKPDPLAEQKSSGKPAREIPRLLARVLQTAIEKDPGRRFQSAREFRHALMEALCDVSFNSDRPAKTWSSFFKSGASGSPRVKRTWLRGIRLDIALIAMIVIFVAALGLYPGKDKPKRDPSSGLQKKGAMPDYRRPTPKKENPPQDPYKELRKAWNEN